MSERRKLQSKNSSIKSNPKESGCVAIEGATVGTHKLILTFKDGDSTQLLALDNSERGLVLDNFDDVVTITVLSTPLTVTVKAQALTYLTVSPGTTTLRIIDCPNLVAISLPTTCTLLEVKGESILRKPLTFDNTTTVYKNEQLKNKFYSVSKIV